MKVYYKSYRRARPVYKYTIIEGSPSITSVKEVYVFKTKNILVICGTVATAAGTPRLLYTVEHTTRSEFYAEVLPEETRYPQSFKHWNEIRLCLHDLLQTLCAT